MQNDTCPVQPAAPETPLAQAPGPRQTALSTEDLAAYGRRLFGKRHWRVRMAEALGVPRSTVGRWASGKMAVRPTSAIAIRGLLDKHKLRKLIA